MLRLSALYFAPGTQGSSVVILGARSVYIAVKEDEDGELGDHLVAWWYQKPLDMRLRQSLEEV